MMKPLFSFDTYFEAAIAGIVIGLWLGFIAFILNGLIMLGSRG